jgi:hypothetical protein
VTPPAMGKKSREKRDQRHERGGGAAAGNPNRVCGVSFTHHRIGKTKKKVRKLAFALLLSVCKRLTKTFHSSLHSQATPLHSRQHPRPSTAHTLARHAGSGGDPLAPRLPQRRPRRRHVPPLPARLFKPSRPPVRASPTLLHSSQQLLFFSLAAPTSEVLAAADVRCASVSPAPSRSVC